MSEPVEITKDVVRDVVWSGNEHVKEHFREKFETEVEDFVDAFHRAYTRFKDVEKVVKKERRSAWAQMFLYAALNSLVNSTHLLVSGFIGPSGNLMRQFGEAVAMSLLLSHRSINTFDIFHKKPMEFPVHKAVIQASRRRNAKLLNLDTEGWNSFKRITSFYDKYSHASALVTASMMMLGRKGALVFGSEFDEEKTEAYSVELKRRISACESMEGIIGQVERQLLQTAA